MPSLLESVRALGGWAGWSAFAPAEPVVQIAGSTGPQIGRVATDPVPERQDALDEALELNKPEDVHRIIAEADRGRTPRVINLCKTSRRRDSRLGAVCAVRILAIQSRAWVLTEPPGYEDDDVAKLNVARCTRIFNEVQGLQQIIGHFALAVLEGHAVGEHQFRTNARGEWVSQPTLPRADRFIWGAEGIAKYDAGLDPYEGTPLANWPGKFIVHTPAAGESDDPWKRGAERSLLLGSYLKRLGVRFWLKMIERWGQPQIVATYAQGAENQKTKILDALRAIGTDWRGVFPTGTTVTPLNYTLASDLHEKFVQAQNVEQAIRILGQNLTTEVQGGSFAATSAHERMFMGLLIADLGELAETITDQWVRRIVELNWPGTPVPVWTFIPEQASPWTVQEWQAGLCTADEYRSGKGVESEPDGKGDRYYAGPAPLPTAGLPLGGQAPDPFFLTPARASMTVTPRGVRTVMATGRSPTKSRSTNPRAA